MVHLQLQSNTGSTLQTLPRVLLHYWNYAARDCASRSQHDASIIATLALNGTSLSTNTVGETVSSCFRFEARDGIRSERAEIRPFSVRLRHHAAW